MCLLHAFVVLFGLKVAKILLFKKYKTCTVFLSSYTNTRESLGEREMLWEDEP